MPRHSFIQMSKLPDLKGRISYIGSPDRQENLFAVYDTADTEFWTCLARESRQEFKRCGTEGKCIEARELIIALPENYTRYDPDEVLKEFTERFKGQYLLGLCEVFQLLITGNTGFWFFSFHNSVLHISSIMRSFT